MAARFVGVMEEVQADKGGVSEIGRWNVWVVVRWPRKARLGWNEDQSLAVVEITTKALHMVSFLASDLCYWRSIPNPFAAGHLNAATLGR